MICPISAAHVLPKATKVAVLRDLWLSHDSSLSTFKRRSQFTSGLIGLGLRASVLSPTGEWRLERRELRREDISGLKAPIPMGHCGL